MAESARLYYQGVLGRTLCRVNWARLTGNSAVAVSATETSYTIGNHVNLNIPVPGRTPEQQAQAHMWAEIRAWQKEWPILGSANVYVTNIAPRGDGRNGGGVDFFLHVDWTKPLPVMVTVTWLGECTAFGV
jgi:hypothetical protein